MEVSGWATSAGHWYDAATGEPRYSIIGKNGKERATTLRDARKHGWLPSVTTVIASAARPGLERWKAEQVLLAGLTLPRQDGESEPDWIGRVWADSKEQARKAAERGTLLHAAIERHYRGEPVPDEFNPWIEPVERNIAFTFGAPAWLPERSFSHSLGFGGKVDLHAEQLVLDVKTKDGDLSDVEVYDEHIMQLAAYAKGLRMERPRAGILFVSRTQPSATVREVTLDLSRGWAMFANLFFYWRDANQYYPAVKAQKQGAA